MKGLDATEAIVLRIFIGGGPDREGTAAEHAAASRLLASGRLTTAPCHCGKRRLEVTPAGREALKLHDAVLAGAPS